MKCAVLNCCKSNNNKASDCSFFTFPSDEALRKKWISFCRRGSGSFNPKTAFICMQHFLAEDFENSLKFQMGFCHKLLLKRGSVPTQKARVDPNSEIVEFDERRIRKEARSNKEMIASLLKDSKPPPLTTTSDEITLEEMETIMLLEEKIENLRRDTDGLKEASKKYVDEIESLNANLQKAKSQRDTLETRLSCMFTDGQIDMLNKGLRRIVWKKADIADAFTLYATSAKAYELLRKNNYPLPGVRTLQVWANKSRVKPFRRKPLKINEPNDEANEGTAIEL